MIDLSRPAAADRGHARTTPRLITGGGARAAPRLGPGDCPAGWENRQVNEGTEVRVGQVYWQFINGLWKHAV